MATTAAVAAPERPDVLRALPPIGELRMARDVLSSHTACTVGHGFTPIFERRGVAVFAVFNYATQSFGGAVTLQRFELATP
jgi:hypothetical protein